MERITETIPGKDTEKIVKVVITPDEHEILGCNPRINFVPFPPEGQGEPEKYVAYGITSNHQVSQLEDALDSCK